MCAVEDVKARAGEGRKSRQAEWIGLVFLVGDGWMYGMYGWVDGRMDG